MAPHPHTTTTFLPTTHTTPTPPPRDPTSCQFSLCHWPPLPLPLPFFLPTPSTALSSDLEKFPQLLDCSSYAWFLLFLPYSPSWRHWSTAWAGPHLTERVRESLGCPLHSQVNKGIQVWHVAQPGPAATTVTSHKPRPHLKAQSAPRLQSGLSKSCRVISAQSGLCPAHWPTATQRWACRVCHEAPWRMEELPLPLLPRERMKSTPSRRKVPGLCVLGVPYPAGREITSLHLAWRERLQNSVLGNGPDNFYWVWEVFYMNLNCKFQKVGEFP